MKKVFTKSTDVIHLFAQRTQSVARSSNVFFYGDKIYSYGHHYLLGEFIQHKNGGFAIIINDKGYSNTTAKHISEITQATRQYKQFFTSNAELSQVLYSIKENVQKLQNARKKELYILPSQAKFEKLNEFINWTERKDMRKDSQYKEIEKLMAVINGGNYSEYLAKEQKRISAEKRKAEKIRIAKLQKSIDDFLNFESYRIYGSNEDYLRITPDFENVQTSQGIEVTVKEAVTLYKMILAGKDIRGFKISNYTVTSINGVLKIGCHNINIKNMHEVGKKLIEANL